MEKKLRFLLKVTNKTNNYNSFRVFIWKSASLLTDLCNLQVQKLDNLGRIQGQSWKSFLITHLYGNIIKRMEANLDNTQVGRSSIFKLFENQFQ
jgi:hypothetical protein